MHEQEKQNEASEKKVAPAELQAAPVQFQAAASLQSAELMGLTEPIPTDPRAAQSDNVNRGNVVQASGGQPAGPNVHQTARHGVSGGGGALPHLGQIQHSFGAHDVSGVKAHVGGTAADASDAMGAQAYATGNDVAFKAAPDLHTAAHEAAHVVQQRGGVSLKGGVGESGDAYEQHADRVAEAVVAGQSAEPVLDEMSGGSGSAKPPIQRLPGVWSHSPVTGGAPVLAIQCLDGKGGSDKKDGGGEPPQAGGGAGDQATVDGVKPPEGMKWAKPLVSQAKDKEVRYFVPVDTQTADAVPLSSELERYVFPKDPNAHKMAQEFEVALGQHALSGNAAAQGASSSMAQAALAILDDYAKTLHQLGAEASELETLVGDVLGKDKPGYAGAVGKSEAVIREAAAVGNVREQLFMATNFAWSFGKKLAEQRAGADAFIQQVGQERALLAKQLEKVGDVKPDGEVNTSLTGGMTPGAPGDSAATTEIRASADKEMGEQKAMRAETPEVAAHKEATKSDTTSTPGQKAAADPTRTAKKGGQAALSDREASFQLGHLSPDTDQSAMTSEQIQQEVAGKQLLWGEGIRRFVLSETHPFVVNMRSKNLPVAAGPSGTTRGVMQARQLLAVSDPTSARAAAVGYLLPIHAHSLMEILIGASAVDGPADFPRDFSVYLHIPPFNGKAIYPNDAFWALVESTQKQSGGK